MKCKYKFREKGSAPDGVTLRASLVGEQLRLITSSQRDNTFQVKPGKGFDFRPWCNLQLAFDSPKKRLSSCVSIFPFHGNDIITKCLQLLREFIYLFIRLPTRLRKG